MRVSGESTVTGTLFLFARRSAKKAIILNRRARPYHLYQKRPRHKNKALFRGNFFARMKAVIYGSLCRVNTSADPDDTTPVCMSPKNALIEL